MLQVTRVGGKNTIISVPDFFELELVENGFGYYGVLLYDDFTNEVQCHLCGEWHRSLGQHLIVHNTTAKDYKEAFVLSKHMGLCVPDLSNVFRQHAIDTDLVSKIKNPMPMSEVQKLLNNKSRKDNNFTLDNIREIDPSKKSNDKIIVKRRLVDSKIQSKDKGKKKYWIKSDLT